MKCPRCCGLTLREDYFEGPEETCSRCGYVRYPGGLTRDLASILDDLEAQAPANPREEPDEVSVRRSASAGRGWATRRREASKPRVSVADALARARTVLA